MLVALVASNFCAIMLVIISKIHRLFKTSLNVYQAFLCFTNLLYCTVILYISVSNIFRDHHYNFVLNTADKTNFSVSDSVFSLKKFYKNLNKNSRSFSEKVIGYFLFLYFFLSSYTLLLMAINRLFFIISPIKYKTLSIKFSIITTVLIFIIGVLVSFIPLMLDNFNLFYFENEKIFTVPYGKHSLIFLLIIYLFPLLASLLTNILCQYYFKKVLKVFYETNSILTTNQIQIKNREKILFRTLFCISVFSLVSIFPMFLLIFISLPFIWNKKNYSVIYIPKSAFFQFKTVSVFVSIFLICFNIIIQMIIFTKTDYKIKLGLHKMLDSFHYKFVQLKTTFSNCFSLLIDLVETLRMSLSNCFQCIRNTWSQCFYRDRIEIVGPPRVPQNPGRANVYFESNF